MRRVSLLPTWTLAALGCMFADDILRRSERQRARTARGACHTEERNACGVPWPHQRFIRA